MHLIIEKSKENTKLPEVMRAAVSLFVQKGIHGTTIKDIAHKAGVSEGALYRHYKSKEELAWHVFSTHLNDFSMHLGEKLSNEKTVKDKMRVYISTCLEAFEEDRELFSYLIISEHRELSKFPSTHIHPGHVALKLMEEGQGTGELKVMDHYVAASILVGSVIRICIVKMYDGIKDDLKNHVHSLTESLWLALKK